jgi:ribonuclease BN (tRNA processing enzyme)
VALNLTILGCSGTYAAAGNACSSYLVRTDTTTLLLDLGPGALAKAQEHIELVDVDAIVLTHEHPDHWLDLPVARNAYRYIFDRAHLPVYATGPTIAQATPFCDNDATFDWTELADGSRVAIGDLDLRFSRTAHPVETLAVWIESGAASFLYSADTGPGWWPTAFDARPDLALIEATYEEAQEHDVHLTARQEGERARSVGAGRLVLTHIHTGVDPERQRAAAAETFGKAVEVATSGATFTIGPVPG